VLPRPTALEAAAAVAAGGATIALAGANGGFDPPSWCVGSLVAAWIVLLALVFGAADRPGPLAVALLALAVGLEVWTALSAVWSASVSSSFLEAERMLLYALGIAAVAAVGTRVSLGSVAAGVWGGAVVVCSWDLAVGGGNAAHRAFAAEAPPIGYANSLALLAALGMLLAVGFALARRPFALLGLGAFLPVLVEQRSYGSWAALGAGLVALALLRLPLPVAAVVGGLAVVAAAFAIASWSQARGHERGAYWSVAARALGAHPFAGSGAGTFDLSWLRLRHTPIGTLDAHSLYLETFDELGIVGLALVLGLALVPVAAALRLRGSPLAAGAAAAWIAWALAAGIDFHWEMASVTLPALLVAATLVVAADGRRDGLRAPLRSVAAVAVVLVAVAAALALTGNELVAHAHDALARGDYAAASRDGESARSWQPWSPEPWELIGLAQLRLGLRGEAADAFQRAARKEPLDPRLWLLVAQATTGEPRRRALARVARLDPLYFGAASGP
jgi:hypothetical protein